MGNKAEFEVGLKLVTRQNRREAIKAPIVVARGDGKPLGTLRPDPVSGFISPNGSNEQAKAFYDAFSEPDTRLHTDNPNAWNQIIYEGPVIKSSKVEPRQVTLPSNGVICKVREIIGRLKGKKEAHNPNPKNPEPPYRLIRAYRRIE